MHPLILLLSQALIFPQQPDIYLEVIGKPSHDKNWAFYAPHENENISNQYVAKKIKSKGGVFVVMRQNGERFINLKINKLDVRVDPNRIFTHRGRVATIKKLNSSVAPHSETFSKATERAKQLSDFILKTMGGINTPKTWVAIHNNTNGYKNDGQKGIGNISIVRYQQKLTAGAQYLIDVASSDHDEDDLYFVTKPIDFKAMKDNSWNVVLQNPNVAHDSKEDDGSLSVYAEMIGFRYINVEAERTLDGFGNDHVEVQQRMIDFMFTLLD